jgi:hypothetical protein
MSFVAFRPSSWSPAQSLKILYLFLSFEKQMIKKVLRCKKANNYPAKIGVSLQI